VSSLIGESITKAHSCGVSWRPRGPMFLPTPLEKAPDSLSRGREACFKVETRTDELQKPGRVQDVFRAEADRVGTGPFDGVPREIPARHSAVVRSIVT